MKQNVVIFHEKLIKYSETFIPAQGESLSSHTGFYVGISKLPGVEYLIPKNRLITLSDTVLSPKFWQVLFKSTGIIHPNWMKAIENISPSLIHAHFGPGGLRALPLAKKLKIPLVVTFHGYDVTIEAENLAGLTYKLYTEKCKQLFQEAKLFIAVSNFIHSKLIQRGCPENKILVHYIGIDIEKFKPDPEVLREPIVLFVGRLVEKKGCKYLIRAMAQVQSANPDVKLVIIGDGPLKIELEELASKLLLSYEFLGAQPSEVVKSWMNRAKVFCVPSITAKSGDSEGFGMVFTEAQAMGLPVVSFVSGGIPEAVLHEETGLLAKEKDWETLAMYILTLFSNEELRQHFVLAGRQHVEEKFNLKNNTAKLEEIYCKVAQQNY